MSDTNWQSVAEHELGARFGSLYQLGGGDFAQSFCVSVVESESDSDLKIGDQVFIKTHTNPPPFHFSTEACGLRWLKDTESVSIPKVLGVSDDPPYLALEWIDEGNRDGSSESEFGGQLARLHAYPCEGYGRQDLRSTGSLGLPNEPCNTWAEFYATQRLLPLAKIATDRNALSAGTIKRIERLCGRLTQFTELDVPASRLHGDLWAGNRIVDRQGYNWLIDPACHGGSREFDLAMMRLFGGYGDACFRAYHERHPVADGWQERVSLHQLAPLIVHAIKFGRSYVGPTNDALAKYI